jgi:hypothetical protein
LTRGNFLGKVIKFVLFIPVTITAIVRLVNIAITDKHCAKEDYHCLSSKELVYEENLYREEHSGIDTLGIMRCEEEGKSCTILKQSNLPDSIKEKQEDPSLLWTVYYHFIDPGNQHMTTTHRGRIISGIIATLGFLLLNGLLISMLISWIDRRREQWLKGEVRYKSFLRRAKKKFYIVIGGNDVAIGIVSELFVNNKVKKLPYIVIQTLRDVESFRRELFSNLTEEQQKTISTESKDTDSTAVTGLATDFKISYLRFTSGGGNYEGEKDSYDGNPILRLDAVKVYSSNTYLEKAE